MSMALLNLLKLMMLSLLRPVPQKKKKKKRNLLTPDIIEYKCIAKFEVSLTFSASLFPCLLPIAWKSAEIGENITG